LTSERDPSSRHLPPELAGLAGAILTGIGEGLLHFVPGGQYTDQGYSYFANISEGRLFIGHFLGVAAAPLYIAGYWQLTANLFPARRQLRLIVFAICAYAFIIGTVWIGQRAFLGLTVQAISSGRADPGLLASLSTLNDPLINVLRIAILGFSLLWVLMVSSGRTRYPRWMAWLSPAFLITMIFGLYAVWPVIGSWFVPAALNVAHIILFSASLLTLHMRHSQ